VLITPVPGVSSTTLRTALTNVRYALSNTMQAGQLTAIDRAQRYLEWYHEARRSLRSYIRQAELEHLLPPQSYELVLAGLSAHPRNLTAGADLGSVRLLNGLVAMQADERSQDLDDAVAELDRQVKRWNRPTQLVVLDTNIYMHHRQKLEDLDLAAELTLGVADIHVVVPMVVVDELDKGKMSGGDKGYRAGYSVAYIDRVVQGGGRIRTADHTKGEQSRGEVTIEVLLDPPGHVRLPINDDEIVDRTLTLEGLAGRQVRLVTHDTGMAVRGRAAGLKVIKLEQPEQEGRKRGRGQRGRGADGGEHAGEAH
jgi:PIN domain-containing protein